MQRLEVLVAVMLARERRRPADTAADGCTKIAAALAALPSRRSQTRWLRSAAPTTREGLQRTNHTAPVRTSTLRRRPTMSTVIEPHFSAATLFKLRTLLEKPDLVSAGRSNSRNPWYPPSPEFFGRAGKARPEPEP